MVQLQQIIEEANRKLVIAKINGDWEVVNALQILIGESECALKEEDKGV